MTRLYRGIQYVTFFKNRDMGFDVYGVNPKRNTEKKPILLKDYFNLPEDEREEYIEASKEFEKENPGEYFRNNVWWWRPLWDYVCNVCKDVMSEKDVQAGHYNDGVIINAETCDAMLEKLMVELATDGHTNFANQYKVEQENAPLEDCDLCEGTGKRKPAPQTGAGDVHCNKCDGKGETKPWSSNYPFSVENVEEFVSFLSECGGMQIC